MSEKFQELLVSSGIHANWPIYPSGIGWKFALKTLGNFPNGTILYEVDDIDRCKLLINQELKKLSDPFDSNYYHVAIWHNDLIELKHKGFIEGVVGKSNYEFEVLRYENIKRAFGSQLKLDKDGNCIFYFKDDNGKLNEIKYYKPQSIETEHDFVFRDECAVISEGIFLSENGIKELYKLSNEITLNEELFTLTQPLIKIQRYDTAIREASLLVETKLREYHKQPDLYGQKLVESHIFEIINKNNGINSEPILCYRGELRTIFKFIRNDFAHNFKILTEEQCKFILARISNTLTAINDVTSSYFETKNI